MNFLKEGGSLERPPLFDGTNYAYWRVQMRAFISTLDEKAWLDGVLQRKWMMKERSYQARIRVVK